MSPLCRCTIFYGRTKPKETYPCILLLHNSPKLGTKACKSVCYLYSLVAPGKHSWSFRNLILCDSGPVYLAQTWSPHLQACNREPQELLHSMLVGVGSENPPENMEQGSPDP